MKNPEESAPKPAVRKLRLPDPERMYKMVLEHARRSVDGEEVDDFEIARSIPWPAD